MSAIGFFTWFARHDSRLAWRRLSAFFNQTRPVILALMLGAGLIVFHLLGYAAANRLGAMMAQDNAAAATSVILGFLFVLPWIVSQTMMNATRALYSRGDLDLMLSSPAPARSLFAARAYAIVFESLVSIFVFIGPLANMLAFVLGWRWLMIYPTLLATGFFGAAIGLVLTVGLFAGCGPKQTRAIAQLVAVIIGAGFALSVQLSQLAPEGSLEALRQKIELATGSVFFAPDVFWRTPIRAAMGDGACLLWWMVFSVALFSLVAWTSAAIFADGVITTQGYDRQRRSAHASKKFVGGVTRNLLLKEMRLITRDPWLAAQLLQQFIYTLPLSLILWKAQGPNGSIAFAVMPSVVVMATHIASALAWLAISSEDAPEFLQTAPISSSRVTLAKLMAIATPIALFVTPAVLGIGWVWPKEAAITALFAVFAAASAATLNLWSPTPGKRAELARRHAQSKLVAVIEHLLSLLWATALMLALFESWLCLIPSALAMFVLWLNRPKRDRGTMRPKQKFLEGLFSSQPAQ